MPIMTATATVAPDGTVTLRVSEPTEPGEYQVALLVSSEDRPTRALDIDSFLALAGGWSDWSEAEFQAFLDDWRERRRRGSTGALQADSPPPEGQPPPPAPQCP